MVNEKEIVEINGTRFEVDLSTAKKITEFKVGDMVKVLVKKYSSYESMIGTIIGFDYFKNRPAVNLVYLENDYSPEIHFLTYTADSTDIEIAPIINKEELSFNKFSVVEKLDKVVGKKKEEIKELEMKKQYFINNFQKFFDDE